MKVNFRKTKILGKIADNKAEEPFLQSVFDAGLDLAWLNTAHQGEAEAEVLIGRIRKVAPHSAILIDTKGPEVRTKNIETSFAVTAEQKVYFSGNLSFKADDAPVIYVDYPNFHNEVPVGTVMLYDDATIGIYVTEKITDALICKVQNPGTIKNKKSINTPGVHIELPALTEKDKSFIRFCGKHNVEYIIHSFVRGKQDIDDIKAITGEFPGYNPGIIAKLENREGFDNREEILDNCDGLMVARGDLAAEVPFRELPYMQKKMIESAVKKGKACIVATQVLDSMIKNPRPTRAEVLDVANAILEGSGAVSMSGETAYGDYPVEATTTMADIMSYTEDHKDELTHYAFGPEINSSEYTEAKKIVDTAKSAQAKAILVAVTNPALSYALSAYRPSCTVITASSSEIETRKLVLYYALRPLTVSEVSIKSLLAGIDSPAFGGDDTVVLVTEESGNFATKTVKFKDLA